MISEFFRFFHTVLTTAELWECYQNDYKLNTILKKNKIKNIAAV